MDKIQIIEKLLFYINSYSYLLLPLSLFFVKVKKRDALVIAIYGFIFFFPVFYGHLTPMKYQKLFLVSYTFVEYVFLTFIIWLNIESKGIKKIILFLSILFLIYQVIFFLTADISVLDSVPIGIETLLLITYITVFLFEQFKTQKTEYIYNHHCFWFAIGILIYLGGSFFFNILAIHIEEKQRYKYWQITLVGETLKNFLFIIAIIYFSSNSIKGVKKKDITIPYLDII